MFKTPGLGVLCAGFFLIWKTPPPRGEGLGLGSDPPPGVLGMPGCGFWCEAPEVLGKCPDTAPFCVVPPWGGPTPGRVGGPPRGLKKKPVKGGRACSLFTEVGGGFFCKKNPENWVHSPPVGTHQNNLIEMEKYLFVYLLVFCTKLWKTRKLLLN